MTDMPFLENKLTSEEYIKFIKHSNLYSTGIVLITAYLIGVMGMSSD